MGMLTQSNGKPPRAAKHPMTWYMPRFWHGMRLGAWTRELVRNRLAVSPSRMPMVCSITCFTTINSILSVIDEALYGRKIASVELKEPPLFILGHWRSGTTFLHELLIRDPAHTFANTYECFAPHHFLVSGDWAPAWTNFLLPSRRPMDNMAAGWDRPQEDEFALQNLGIPSPYLSMLFPNRGPAYGRYLTLRSLSERDRRAWQQALLRFFQRIAIRDDRRIVVKSPAHTARMRAILEVFPDARFIHISRDPYSLYPSTVKLWHSLNEQQGAQVAGKNAWVEPYVLATLKKMYDAYFADRGMTRPGRLVELKYEDMIENPKERIREIYAALDLGDFARIEPALDAHLADVKNYRPNKHQLDDATRDTIRREWGEYFTQFGYG